MVDVASPLDALPPIVIRRMAKAIESVRELESLSHVVQLAVRATGDPSSDSADVARIISLDQALTARVMGMANSAYLGGVRRIGNIQQAVVRLGYRTIREILFSAATMDVMQRPSELHCLARGELWRYSLASAIASRLVAEKVGFKDRDTAYIAGLLHDVGLMVIDRAATKEEADAIRRLVSEDGKAYFEAETEILGYDHAAIGRLLMTKWQLDDGLASSVAAHHSPAWCRNDPLAAIVHIADAIGLLACKIWRPGWTYSADSDLIAHLGLNANAFTATVGLVVENLSKVESALSAPRR